MAPEDEQDVAVVGAGLVGSLLPIFLARRGLQATVYERSEDIRRSDSTAGRSINLVLTARGIVALERVGLDREAQKLTVPVYGRMIHSPRGELSYQPYGKDESECNYSISRRKLNQFLVSAAEQRGVRFRFRQTLTAADLDRGLLRFRDAADASQLAVRTRRVIGADGAVSALRAEMMQREGFAESVELLQHDYKELQIPVAQGRRLETNALHIWPRGDMMLMALPNLDRSFTVTLYLPRSGPSGFEGLDTAAKVLDLFGEQFADAMPLIPDLAQSFLANPTGNLGTVKCVPWHYNDRALLIGDAAHAIVPFFGQGMNCGFEDCVVLDDLLERHGLDRWETVFDEFYRSRKPDADAIADMALENFIEMRDRVGDERFLLRKQVEHLLEQTMPREYRSRYSMVMYSSIPYHVAFEAGLLQREILDELCEGLQDAARVDLDRARELIRLKLTPYLEDRAVALDY